MKVNYIRRVEASVAQFAGMMAGGLKTSILSLCFISLAYRQWSMISGMQAEVGDILAFDNA